MRALNCELTIALTLEAFFFISGRAEQKSIARIMELVGCTEQEAERHLIAHGWSVHNTVATLLNVNTQQSAPASLHSPAAAGFVLHSPEITEDEKLIAIGLYMSIVAGWCVFVSFMYVSFETTPVYRS